MLGETIHERIKALGLTQTSAAEAIGMPVQNLNPFINGKRGIPYDKLMKLLKVLGLSVGEKGEYITKYPPEQINDAIYAAMRARGMKNYELAELSGVNVSTISLFFTGKRTMNVMSLDKVLKALDLTLVSYVGGY